MSPSPLRTEIADGIARLTLATPANGNSIDPAMAGALKDAAAELAARDDVRVVVLAGEGRFFCVGGSIDYFASADDPRAALHALATDLHDGLLGLAALDAPVVAKVQGAAAGAGMSLVCAADLAIGGPGASFTVAYTGIGLSPDGGSSWLLPRLVGRRVAAELMLTNRRVKADEARALGLLNEVVPEEELDARVDEIAEKLAAGPVAAHGAVKRLLDRSATATLADQLQAEADSIADLAGSPTGVEGAAAFLAKRPPVFP
ncbi:enoyl-CoA hydratase [Conexibacter sp. W3-3-2]|uniref:enoyl-CoA hydratase/isomerase family protein n=1 Tax=Conexibacter sp. W3-3-2 TaxID=2675227 RepID=UPI0012B9C0EB|nr:enoyl-CoA hydratase-related protein [Conexibacter sp. W3-3-2]MTD45994.1 enoyl-CoA hydratase [Conexibacter sp. W3-3-2]